MANPKFAQGRSIVSRSQRKKHKSKHRHKAKPAHTLGSSRSGVPGTAATTAATGTALPTPARATNFPPLDNGQLIRLATYASVAVAVTLMAVKAAAYVQTNSVALLTSLVDSLLDSAASSLNLFAVRHALQPADDKHRFGHGKAEALAGLGQAVLILGSALFLIYESVDRMLHPQPVAQTTVGVVIMLLSMALTLALVAFQRYVLRRTGSLAVSADSLHYVGDVLANGSVIVALLIVDLFEWPYADPLFALGVTAYIVRSAWAIIAEAYRQLMDHELPDPDRECIRRVAMINPYVLNIHDLRTRTAGQTRFIQFHLEMRPDLTLAQAHAISDQVELQLLRIYPDAQIIIHEDPVRASTLA